MGTTREKTLLDLKPMIAEYAVALYQDEKTNLTMQEAIDKAIKHFEGVKIDKEQIDDIKNNTDICNTFCCYEDCEKCVEKIRRG
jgi:hypothetical protein